MRTVAVKETIAAVIRAAVAEAGEAVAVHLDEAAAFYRKCATDDPLDANRHTVQALEHEAASIRAQNEREAGKGIENNGTFTI